MIQSSLQTPFEPTRPRAPPSSGSTRKGMASDETMTIQYFSSSSSSSSSYVHDATDDDGDCPVDPHHHDTMYCDGDDEDDGEGRGGLCLDDTMGIRMSCLSIETLEGDADAELSADDDGRSAAKEAKEDDEDEDDSIDFDGDISCMSLPGTPTRATPRQRAAARPRAWIKDYSSETEARQRGPSGRKKSGSRRVRDRWLDQAWEMKKLLHTAGAAGGEVAGAAESHDGGSPRLVFRQRGTAGGCMVSMDMEEVKACRDLGLGLPCDWTVELPGGGFSSGSPASSGGDSPISNWQISSPGDDPREVKARLRVWAQAVALASASHLSN